MLILKKCVFIDFRERGEKERNIDMRKTLISCLLYAHLSEDRIHKQSMCPVWESNPQPFVVGDNASDS